MDLTISDKDKDFFKQIWKIIGFQDISKGDLIYKICYKMNLPFRPSLINKKIKDAEEKGELVRKGNLLTLSKELSDNIKAEEKIYAKKHAKIFPSQNKWDRIEGSSDPWNIKSSTNNYAALVKKALFDDEISRGQKVNSEQIESTKVDTDNLIIEATIRGSGDKHYSMKIDLPKRKIFHDCDDFIHHRIKNRELCKHFFRVLINLKNEFSDVGTEFLKIFSEGREDWLFLEPN